jgi:hypothetical protein
MQATKRLGHSFAGRLKIGLIAAGVLVGSLTTLAAIDRVDDGAPAAGTQLSARASASDAERRQLAMERDDFAWWQRETIPYAEPQNCGS